MKNDILKILSTDGACSLDNFCVLLFGGSLCAKEQVEMLKKALQELESEEKIKKSNILFYELV